MSNQNLLIFGPEAAPRSGPAPIGALGSRFGPADTAGSSRVPIEATEASLKAVMEQVSSLVLAAKDAVGELRIAHVDVALAIAADGSVGLLGTTVGAGAKATLTVRLQG
jgi:hypothetical protein